MRTKDPWTRPRGRPPTDAEDLVLNLASEGNADAQAHVDRSPYLRDQARWASAIEALNAIGRAQRPEETIGEAGERLAKQARSRKPAPVVVDVLEAAHELRLLGCEGESAHEVMVDAARVLSESKTANVRLQVKVQRIGGALDRVRHTIAQELEAHELALAEPRPPVG